VQHEHDQTNNSANTATNLSNGCDSAVAPLTVQVELGELSKIIQRRDS